MRRVLLLSIAMILATIALSADIRIAYYDSEQIRNDWSEFRDAQGKFDKEMVEYEAEADSMQNELMELRADYEKQSMMLSDDKRVEKEKIIMQKQQEYQAFLQQVFGEGGLAEQRNQKLTEPLVEKISVVLQEMANTEGYSLILDASGAVNNIAYIDESLDITDKVVEELKN
ncbi:MAG: OmpH family outer membrane protein [Candidatus Zixiibacteriota bacterium]